MAWVDVAVLGVAAGSAAYSAHVAHKRNKEAQANAAALRDKISNPPDYTIPSEYQTNQNLVLPYTKTSQLAGQAYMQNQVDNNSANSVAKAQRDGLSGSAITSVLASANNASNNAATNMDIAGAQQRQSYIDRSMNANQQTADQKAIQWNLDTNQPYQNWMSYYRDMYLGKTAQSNQAAANAQGQIVAGAGSLGGAAGGLSGKYGSGGASKVNSGSTGIGDAGSGGGVNSFGNYST